jgi:lipoprotein-anchoring transpeptidase ErfK/SrfK
MEEKRIEINTADQYLVAIEQETPVFAARIASGAVFSNGDYSTPHGRHTVFHKRPSRHMAAGNLAANGYDLPGVPWVSYFTESGIAIHGTYWHNNYGAPRSHGCINLTPSAARWIFRWTLPSVPFTEQRVYKDTGTTVNVR